MLSHSATHSLSHSVGQQLAHQDIRRYSRQLLLDCIDHDGQLYLSSAHAVIVGLGGLGSLTARYLAGAGVGNITLIDGDTVDISNLQRQISYNEMHLGAGLHRQRYGTKTDKPGLVSRLYSAFYCSSQWAYLASAELASKLSHLRLLRVFSE